MNYTFYTEFIEMLGRDGAQKTAEYAKKMGFSSVEVLETVGEGHPRVIPDGNTAADVKRVFDEYGITVACYSVGCDVYRRPEAEDVLVRHAEIAAALGCPYLHHTLKTGLRMEPDAPAADEVLAHVAAAAIRVADRAKPLGVTCLYEDQGMYANGIENFGRFYREVHRVCDNTGVCGDFGNILFVDEDPVQFLSAFASDIRHVHVKDYLRKNFADAVPTGGWYPTKHGQYLRDTTVGAGIIDIPACMKVLHDAGYNGAYALELCHPEPFDGGVRVAMQYLDAIVSRFS
ncbi:MAG: sugar phosphate isomerase/epimerase [Clostridia bacterium]|nr:sugar phosphate isomerase/epimerase [Clostridia bacterium]